MRADKRSFSFTWMRGGQQKSTGGPAPEMSGLEFDNPVTVSDTGTGMNLRSNSTWYMTTASSTFSSSGVSSMIEASSVTPATAETNVYSKENANLTRNDDSKGRLRRLGNSFTRFGTKYSIIEDEDEMCGVSGSDNPDPPTVASAPGKLPDPNGAKEPMHFDEDGNFIGRSGKLSSRRKSGTSGKDSMGYINGTTSSFGRKINKTVQDVKVSIGNFSQKFRRSTRRRCRMPGTPLTDNTPTRKILGRTPTKLYSPFGIGLLDSPAIKTPKRLDKQSTPRLQRRSVVSGLVYSPANNFGKDLADARHGMEDFHILSRDITRRSVRF